MPSRMPTEPAQSAAAIALTVGILGETSGPNRIGDLGEETVRQSQDALALVNDGVVDEIAVQLD